PQINQGGSIVFPDVAPASVSKLTALWKMNLGQPSSPPADGVSFVVSPGLSDTDNFGEEGGGTGLIVSFDTYDNGGGEAPAISVKYGGVSEDTIDNGGNQVIKTNVPGTTLVTS